MLIFDIETGPDLAAIDRFGKPFNLADVRGLTPEEFVLPAKLAGLASESFDPASVKLGRMTDPVKIGEKIEEARAAHAAAIADAEKQIDELLDRHAAGLAANAGIIQAARDEHRAKEIGRAALSPLTGRILTIGYANAAGDWGLSESENEVDLLAEFWAKYLDCQSERRAMVGFNIANFDVPFIVRRSWLHGLAVPRTVYAQGRYLGANLVDLLQVWKGSAYSDTIKLTELAEFLGCGAKPDGITGADFAQLWANDRPQAIAYLANDLKMTAAVAERLGIV